MLFSKQKSLVRAFQGLILAFGAPLGWLAIRYLQGSPPKEEFCATPGLYLYMLFGTMCAFSVFGWFVGSKEEYHEYLALRDPLTRLFNVRYFRERLAEEVETSHRHSTPLTLIYFDLDHFKNVNDTYGHSIGDELLIEVSKAAAKILRKHEILSRVGGEEFVALLPLCSRESGTDTAERIRRAIASVVIDLGLAGEVSITVSLGVATLVDNEDAKSLYERADCALYKAKSNGRNRVEVV